MSPQWLPELSPPPPHTPISSLTLLLSALENRAICNYKYKQVRLSVKLSTSGEDEERVEASSLYQFCDFSEAKVVSKFKLKKKSLKVSKSNQGSQDLRSQHHEEDDDAQRRAIRYSCFCSLEKKVCLTTPDVRAEQKALARTCRSLPGLGRENRSAL